MKLFLKCAVMLVLSFAVQAADTGFEKRLGRYSGVTLPGGAPLAVELYGTQNEWGNALYAGVSVAPTNNLVVSLGAARQIHRSEPTEEGLGMLDPNSPAMQAQYRAARERLTSMGSSGWRLGGSLKRFKLGLRLQYFTDKKRLESYQVEMKRNVVGEKEYWFTYKLEF